MQGDRLVAAVRFQGSRCASLAMAFLLGLLLTPSLAWATSLSFAGSLATSSADFEQVFSLSADSPVTIQTFGFGGGTNAAGTPVPAGGFDSLVALYSGQGPSASIELLNGNPAASSDRLNIFAPGCPPAGMVTIGTGAGATICGDNELVLPNLPAGTYTLQLTQAGNVPLAVNPGPPAYSSMSAGFSDTTGGVFQTCNITSNGITCANTTSGFAVDIVASNAVLAAVPEPGTLILLGGGIAVMASLRRLRR